MKYDLIVQGPLDNNRLNIIYSKVNFEFVGKVIYSDCTGNIDLALPNLIVINHIDPGENKPRYSKPLNIDRYLVGVRSSLNAVEQKYVLIIRSDINLSFDKITPLLNLDMLNVLDVTTKKFWLKDKWKFHFCDWLYFCEYEKIFNMINSTNYNDLPCTFLDSLFPCSP
ncbi:WavE lipopolysaccharide synthesis family protein, partial [Vibrio splendidus]